MTSASELRRHWLERAYAEHSDWVPTMRYDIAFDRIRQNPRFVALTKKLNLP